MNLIINTDSPGLCSRLLTILSELSHAYVISVANNLDEAEVLINKNDVQVFITAFHNLPKDVFKKLKEIKKNNSSLIVIVLANNTTDQYLRQWQNAGADYVFDQAMHFTKVVDVLSGLIYKNLFESLKSNKSNQRDNI